jgi:hypothetical protein
LLLLDDEDELLLLLLVLLLFEELSFMEELYSALLLVSLVEDEVDTFIHPVMETQARRLVSNKVTISLTIFFIITLPFIE